VQHAISHGGLSARPRLAKLAVDGPNGVGLIGGSTEWGHPGGLWAPGLVSGLVGGFLAGASEPHAYTGEGDADSCGSPIAANSLLFAIIPQIWQFSFAKWQMRIA
jgi:hypothetical protein